MNELRHLIVRFFGHVVARRLDDDERAVVSRHLTEPERALWWAQPVGDQRHAVTAAAYVLSRFPDDRSAVRAALLHDIGKRHSGLGAIGRSFATVARIVHLPRTHKMEQYLDHGPIGAEELEALGAEPLVVDFARHHAVGAPAGADRERWNVLFAADRATKAPSAPTDGNTMQRS